MSRPGRSVRHRRSYVAFLPALNISSFQYHFRRYLSQEWQWTRLGRHREPDATECLRKFDGGYQLHSGQSLWGAWEQQFQDCNTLRGRYIIFCPALRQSRAWRLDTFAVSKVGELMSQVWASEEDEVLYRLANQEIPAEQYQASSHLGVCVPTSCPRSMERMLGFHVVLKKLGHLGAYDVSRSPVRSEVLLRLHGDGDPETHLNAGRQLRASLGSMGQLPAWYLQPFKWHARPSRLGFPAAGASRYFFETRWGMFLNRIQILPRKRVAFCPIPKAGLSQWYMLLNRVGHLNVSYSDFLDGASRFDTRVSGWFASHDYWRDPRWKFVVFVRDPLERFVSAFLDKCLKPSPHCGDDLRLGWQNVSSSSPWREKLRAFRIFVSLPIPTPKMLQNDHWIPQSVYLLHGCQFTWQRLDFVGLMTSDKWQMNLQVRAMLHKLGLSLDLACHLADQYFPIQGFASKFMERHANIHRSHGGSKAHIFHAFYGRKETLQRVMRYVRQDYIA